MGRSEKGDPTIEREKTYEYDYFNFLLWEPNVTMSPITNKKARTKPMITK